MNFTNFDVCRRGRAVLVLLLAAGTAAATDAPRDRIPEFGKILPATLPFSEAVRVGDTLYLSGMIGVTPGTMKVVPGGIARRRQALQNVRTTLETHGYGMRDVVKCTVMLADIGEWAAFNEVYATFFAAPSWRAAMFGTSGLALGARVELDCIAAR
jgi:reactive intermediate/imine deaminase